MASRLGPLEVNCDAPPYSVVRACRKLGFQSPEDVRWCRLSRLLGTTQEQGNLLSFPWKLLFGKGEGKKKTCTCGQALPIMEKFTFTFQSEKKAVYLLGQCAHCRAIFWEETS